MGRIREQVGNKMLKWLNIYSPSFERMWTGKKLFSILEVLWGWSNNQMDMRPTSKRKYPNLREPCIHERIRAPPSPPRPMHRRLRGKREHEYVGRSELGMRQGPWGMQRAIAG